MMRLIGDESRLRSISINKNTLTADFGPYGQDSITFEKGLKEELMEEDYLCFIEVKKNANRSDKDLEIIKIMIPYDDEEICLYGSSFVNNSLREIVCALATWTEEDEKIKWK